VTLVIELPWPSPALWPNRRDHWSVKDREAKQAKIDGAWATLKALDGKPAALTIWPDEGISVKLTFHPPSNRRRDRDNAQAAMKHYLDGIAAALNVNDSLFVPYSDWGELDSPRGTVIAEIGS